MITRFRLEASGISAVDCSRQIEEGVLSVLDIDHQDREDWIITDDVSWKDGPIYRSRIVMKLKENNVED